MKILKFNYNKSEIFDTVNKKKKTLFRSKEFRMQSLWNMEFEMLFYENNEIP